MSSIARLDGVIAAPFTPMHADGSLHLELIPRYYEMLHTNGVKGAFICGSTGEGVSLTLQEKMDVAQAWGACVQPGDDFLLMQLVGGTCLEDCKTLAVHAKSVGIHAISFLAPYYFKPSSVSTLADCCEVVAAAVPDMPFYYYHIPVLTGVSFNMIDLLQAVDGRIPNFHGVKYTHEDLMDYLSCLNFKQGRYNILWGRDETFLSALAVGAKAAVGSTFNYAAPLYNELIAAFERGDLSEATRLQQQSIDMIRLLGKYGGIATGKAYMRYIGFDCGEFRLPVKNMSAADFQKFRDDVSALSMDRWWTNVHIS